MSIGPTILSVAFDVFCNNRFLVRNAQLVEMLLMKSKNL